MTGMSPPSGDADRGREPELADLPGSDFEGAGYGGLVVEELHESARRAQDRAIELRKRTARVLQESRRTLELSASGELGARRVDELSNEVAGLRRAMETRADIEQAKGVIIAATGCDPDTAFGLLAKQSQHENRKLAEIAHELVWSKVVNRDAAEEPEGRAAAEPPRRGPIPPTRGRSGPPR